jgi:hypothetical protein
MRVILVQLALLVVNGVGHAQAPPHTCSYGSPPLELPAPVLLGWPDIEHEGLPPGVARELRVHEDVGLTFGDYSLRIVELGRRVTGELLVTWPGVDYARVTGGDPTCQEWHVSEIRQLRETLLQSQSAYLRCGSVEVRPRVEGCRVLFSADPGWAEMLRRSDSLGIWTVKSAVPNHPGLDGVDVAVEMRDSSGYRRFSYNSPASTGGPGEREGAALARLLGTALEAAHAQFDGK